MSDWKHKDTWKRNGENFLIEVSRHEVTLYGPQSGCYDEEGPHRWCVYAYIYPKHPHFAKFDGEDMWQEAASTLPLHAGPSYLRYHRGDEGEVMSIQVGCDYHHLHDNEFTRQATKEDASEVFSDADRIFDVLSSIAKATEAES